MTPYHWPPMLPYGLPAMMPQHLFYGSSYPFLSPTMLSPLNDGGALTIDALTARVDPATLHADGRTVVSHRCRVVGAVAVTVTLVVS